MFCHCESGLVVFLWRFTRTNGDGGNGVMALIANVSVALMLYAFRDGDANMRSVWLCSRNDSIANIAVILAAVGVFGTGSVFPDLIVAFVIAYLGIFWLCCYKTVTTRKENRQGL